LVSNGKKNFLTVVAIMKNEARSILEWASYYRSMGADAVVIYDNDSTDASSDILRVLDAHGVVKHRPWPSGDLESPQRAAYADALKKDGSDTEWMLFVDADEFATPLLDDTIPDAIRRIAGNDDEISGIAINWRTFGTSGHQTKDDRLVTEKFTLCADGATDPNNCVKSFVRPIRVTTPHIHISEFSSGRYVNERGEDVNIHHMGMSTTIHHGIMQINHYMTKSVEEWELKKSRGNANRGAQAQDKYDRVNDWLFNMANKNDVVDASIQRFLPRLRSELATLKARTGNEIATGWPDL